MELTELITELCSLNAPSGFENAALERIKELATPFADSCETDALGNLIIRKSCGVPHAPVLMLNAHMDEIGFIVTGHEKGFLRFSSLGGVDPRMLPAAEIKVLADPPIFGVINAMPPHALSSEDMDKTMDPKKLFIDVGLSQEQAEKQIPLGTPAVFAADCAPIGKLIRGKALDDRACAAILLKVLESIKDQPMYADLCLLISSQEELGTRGAAPGAFAVAPDYAVTVDVTHAATPDSGEGETMLMGKGAAIGVGPNMHRGLTKTLFDIAEKNDLPYQTEVMGGNTGTDAWVIQVSRTGIATGLVSLPIKYMHTPIETMDPADAGAIVTLLTELALSLGKEEAHA